MTTKVDNYSTQGEWAAEQELLGGECRGGFERDCP
jgi:hypothetical protein